MTLPADLHGARALPFFSDCVHGPLSYTVSLLDSWLPLLYILHLAIESGMASRDHPPCQSIFRGLAGVWKLRRALFSNLPNFPSGTFEGTATFTISPAFNGSSYLYHEIGTLTTDQDYQLKADRKYIYRYDEEQNKISAWFVKEVDGKDDIGYLYHDLEFEHEQDHWVARGDHLCDQDMYWAFYDFRLERAKDGSELTVWGLKHQVKGPGKDYTTDTAYQRQLP